MLKETEPGQTFKMGSYVYIFELEKTIIDKQKEINTLSKALIEWKSLGFFRLIAVAFIKLFNTKRS